MKTEYDFSKSVRGRFAQRDANVSFPTLDKKAVWVGPDGPLGEFIVKESKRTLDSYCAQPNRVTEDANDEQFTAYGGYAHRQLFELVQNSADALLDAPNGKSILIRLTEGFLYCADDGEPIDQRGVTALMFSRLSSKRRTGQIGRFGLGFKSVLRVSNAPEFYSRTGSFRFDSMRAARQIGEITPAERYPVLRLPEPIDPSHERETDEEMEELMSWATNIVRLPLEPGAHVDLAQQIRDFPPEFLLFVDHVRYLTLEVGETSRSFILQDRQGEFHLDTGEGTSRWRLFNTTHTLSHEGRSDWGVNEDSGNVKISWAAPLDRLDRPGQFWAFFPTQTASLVAGILNARWKTNEDRQNLLQGPYNNELIKSAAAMIAKALPSLATSDDPARHLDALPRRHDGADSKQASLLRKYLFANLHDSEIVPDQNGNLHVCGAIFYPPGELTSGQNIDAKPFERWAAYPGRPSHWLHHKALTPIRLARIDRLFHPEREPSRWLSWGAPRASIAEWLQALVEGKEADQAILASEAAIQTAVIIPPDKRSHEVLGEIVLTASGDWLSPDRGNLFLPNESLIDYGTVDLGSCVHPKLTSNRDTLSALRELGLKPQSLETRFRLVAERILENDGGGELSADLHRDFWTTSRKLPTELATDVIREYREEGVETWSTKLRVRTRTGDWKPLHSVLLPGKIVPGDGSRDGEVAVDTGFHEADSELLHALGISEAPRDRCDLSVEPWFQHFLNACRGRFTSRKLKRNPHSHLLKFETNTGRGPLEVLCLLSNEGSARYTDILLSSETTYRPWTMVHMSQNPCPSLKCESPTVWMLRRRGRVRTAGGIVPLANALGPQPKSAEALHALLVHPEAERIKSTFNLAEPTPEFFGEDDPVPLTDIWPGLGQYLPEYRRSCNLIRCERIHVLGQPLECILHATNIHLADTVGDDEPRKLQLVVEELELGLDVHEIDAILNRRTPIEMETKRAGVRQNTTDSERLLAAVGEQVLRAGLPTSLLAVLESDGVELKGVDVAEAAIATWHTDALKQHKEALDPLGPPSRWAGSQRAVEFVRSLGFSSEWAGEREGKRDSFLVVEGPFSLPDLHDYQRTIVENVRNMLCNDQGVESVRRGIISMPTGSGKTRVAVQAIIEAMRYDGFAGGVLWVADRDELCEQAVEAWRQVWSGVGMIETRLLISRMWAGLESPQPTSELHVIVTTVQTLNSRLSDWPDEYGFLANFGLVVFDEAHRSIARSFTSVMQEIGLTRFQRPEEPFLLGLTATPYRGRDEEETKRLVSRYGSSRLDMGAFASDKPEDVVRELQDMGVLAQADHETIEGETFPLEEILDRSLDREEVERKLKEWLALPWLPQRVEERIGQSAERTKRIIETYESHIDPEWPTLIFATSVEHAQTIAALLNGMGIRARAVSGTTVAATRRRVVENFRSGEIKALVNYGVFREGFDAPKTRAIIVARPVYSPNLYFQMIGRGLRGPLNGGGDRCLILNVQDNIENFDGKLAFSELDWLWA